MNSTGMNRENLGKPTTKLQASMGYTDLYANWNIDGDGDEAMDNPWDFGGPNDYPKLQVDFNGDGKATAREFGSQ